MHSFDRGRENGFSPTIPGEEYFLQIAIRSDASLRLTPLEHVSLSKGWISLHVD